MILTGNRDALNPILDAIRALVTQLSVEHENEHVPDSTLWLVLLALGACTATDVVTILEKKRQKLESLEIICSGERAKEPPTVWTKLEILYRLRGRLDDAAVKHAIQLSEDKYCSVAAMLKKTATVSWRYEILPADPSTIQGHL